MRRPALALVVVAALTGCDDVDDRPARWSYMYPAILVPSCTAAACHSKMTAQGGVDLSTRDGAYVVLVGAPCGEPTAEESAPGNLVFPYAPSARG